MSAENQTSGANPNPAKNWETWRNLVKLGATLLAVAMVVWVFLGDYEPVDAIEAATIALVLAPVVAAAAAIERSLETLFDWVETCSGSIVAFLAKSEAWIEEAERGVETARSKFIEAANKVNTQLAEEIAGATDSEAVEKLENMAKVQLDILEHQVGRAESLLASVTTRSPIYRQAKRLGALYISFVMGLLIASFSSVQMLHLLGVFHSPDPGLLTKLDVIITGIVMATGSGPVQSLINLLQQSKEALENVSGFLDSRKGYPPAAGSVE
jgi:hypothetical protein